MIKATHGHYFIRYAGRSRMAEISENLREYYTDMRKNDNARKAALADLKDVSDFYAELGEPDTQLNEYIVEQTLNEQKLDRALTKRGF